MKKMMNFFAFALVAIIASASVITNVSAETLIVAKIGDEEYTTIQAAIDDASSGNTITVVASTTEDVTIDEKITLQAEGNVTITGKIILAGGASGTTIDGFTFVNNTTSVIYAGYTDLSDITISNNTFNLNDDNGNVYAIHINNGYTYNATTSAFVGNPITNLTIIGNTFNGVEEDTTTRVTGILIGSISGTTTISDNTFEHMRNYYAFAIAGAPEGDLIITNNYVSDWDGRTGDNSVDSAIYLGQYFTDGEPIAYDEQGTANITVSENVFVFVDGQAGTTIINGEGLLDGVGINHEYTFENNYWGSENPDFETLMPEIFYEGSTVEIATYYANEEKSIIASTSDVEDSFEVTVPNDTIAGLVSNESELTVQSNGVNVAFDSAALAVIAAALDGYTGTEQITVSVNAITDTVGLTEAMIDVIGDKTVYQLSVYLEDEYIGDFTEGSVTVTLPYELQEGEKADEIVVFYVDEEGNIEARETTYNEEDNTVTFITQGFSYYYVDTVSADVEADVEENPETGDSVLAAAMIGGISLIALAGVSLKLKRN